GDHRVADLHFRDRGSGGRTCGADDDRGRAPVPGEAAQDRVQCGLGDGVDARPGLRGCRAASGQDGVRRRTLAAALALVAGTALLAAASARSSAAALSPKLRPDLAALVSGQAQLDARIPPLLATSVPGEIPYFAVLSEPDDAAHAAQVTALGARVLRAYGSVNAFALASAPAVVESVAALPWVTWLAPV